MTKCLQLIMYNKLYKTMVCDYIGCSWIFFLSKCGIFFYYYILFFNKMDFIVENFFAEIIDKNLITALLSRFHLIDLQCFYSLLTNFI